MSVTLNPNQLNLQATAKKHPATRAHKPISFAGSPTPSANATPSKSQWPPFQVATHVIPGVHFGARPFYTGKFDAVKIITDYGVGKTEEISNNEIKDRFNRVLDYVTRSQSNNPQHSSNRKSPGILEIDSISDIPGGNTDYVGLGLVRLGTADINDNIFIHVVDPGVGVVENHHDRTILVTQHYGLYIGPNNQSLGLLAERLTQLGETPKLYQIDFAKVEALEQERKGNSNYRLPKTIHGRDVFAVVGGAIAGGLKPEAFAVTETTGKPKLLEIVKPDYVQPTQLPQAIGETTELVALRDKTFGNLKILNLPLDDQEFDTLLAQKPRFAVQHPHSGQWIDVPVGTKFSDVPVGDIVLYHGSSPGVRPESRGIEIALHLASAANLLDVPENKAIPLTLKRIG